MSLQPPPHHPHAPHALAVAPLTEVQVLARRGTIGYRRPVGNSARLNAVAPYLHYPARRQLAIGDHVLGIALPNTPMLESPRLRAPTGTVQVEQLITLPTHQAERLYAFFDESYVHPAPGTFNCHYFARRMMGIGKFESGLSRCAMPCYASELISPDQLELGQPYGFVQSRGLLVHSVMGMGDGSRCLSVPGWGKPVVLADAERLHYVFYGRSIHRLLPETIDITWLTKKRRQ